MKRYSYVDFQTQPPVPAFVKPGTWDAIPVDTSKSSVLPGTGYFNIDGNYFEYKATLDNNNVAFRTGGPTGWTIPLQGGLDTAGIEITQGPLTGLGQNQFIVGNYPFFMQALFYIGTRANIDNLQMGFRINGAYSGASSAEPADIDTAYSDLAVLGIRSIDGAPYATTRQTSGVAVSTRASHANALDGSWLALRVNVDAAGAVTYKIGTSSSSGAAATAALASDLLLTAVAYSFTAALVVVPVIVEGGSGTGTPDIGICQYICGLQ